MEATGKTYNEAINAIKAGKKVQRALWVGDGSWIAYTEGVQNLPAKEFWNKHANNQAVVNGGTADVLPYIIFCTPEGNIRMGWTPDHNSDTIASDWIIMDS